SDVKNPADRIAHYLEYSFGPDWAKAASADLVLSGAQLGELEGVSLPGLPLVDIKRASILQRLAKLDEEMAAADSEVSKRFRKVAATAFASRAADADID